MASKSSKKRNAAARADTVAEPTETEVEVEGDAELAEPEKAPEAVKPDPEPVVVKPRAAARPQIRQQTPAQEQANAKAPGKRPRFRVEQDHRTIGPRGITKLAAGSLVTSATHDLVQLAEEGAILVKV